MLIKIVCVGKLKESWWRDGVKEYSRRLGRYCTVEICECADEKTPDDPSDEERDQILAREGERILSKISPQDYVIACAIDGAERTSEAFSGHLERLMTWGKSRIAFVIGGSMGLSNAVLARADERLSFSHFTFPHQMMRVILLEQIYRAFRIMKGEPYHK